MTKNISESLFDLGPLPQSVKLADRKSADSIVEAVLGIEKAAESSQGGSSKNKDR